VSGRPQPPLVNVNVPGLPLGARPVRPRHAASLILLRQGPNGPEVLMGRRPRKSSFAPDVFVFPGGALDKADFDARPTAPLAPECMARTGASPRLATALAMAALRETHEETGLLIAPDLSKLRLAGRAITPTMSPIRFHARFFVADAALAVGDHAETPELSDLSYRTVEEALKLPIIDVTEAVLLRLRDGEPAHPFFFGYRRGRAWIRPLGLV
jgi:8-oxo-dGTP pyrophosphatase MutT (NUDIX family)